jgi:geranylgeranylglycerol-phosphate geranylgeranyltransferase
VTSPLRSLLAWARLLRLGNCAVIGFAAFVGYRLSGGERLSTALTLAVSAALVGASGNVFNDLADLEVDRVNKPWRPLPSGEIGEGEALAACLALALAGVLAGGLVSTLNLLIAASACALLFAYSWRLKREGFAGNVAIALLSALNIVYGGVAGPEPAASLLPAAYAFLVILARELVKGLEDVAGDAAAGIKTVAVRYGLGAALKAGSAAAAALVALSPLPYAALGYSARYLLVALLGVDLPLVLSIYLLWRGALSAWSATRIMKVPLLMGLVAFFVG